MASYTFYWRADTWARREREAAREDSPISYIAGKNCQPMADFEAGDEIFIVNVHGGRIRLGGRLIAEGGPVSEAEAKRRLGSVLSGSDLYVLARPDMVDKFRPRQFLPQPDALGLELINVKGDMRNPKRAAGNPSRIDGQAFRNVMKISEVSAAKLRTLLGLASACPAGPSEIVLDAASRAASEGKSIAVSPVTDPDEAEHDLDADDGQGLIQDSKTRRAIEARAVTLAKEHYEAQGFGVKELGKPFDLLCVLGDLTIHVEVKGTVTAGATVRLTRNEVRDARTPDWRSDLFIVSGIRLLEGKQGVQADGGVSRLIQAWSPLDEDLTPMEFEYRVPTL